MTHTRAHKKNRTPAVILQCLSYSSSCSRRRYAVINYLPVAAYSSVIAAAAALHTSDIAKPLAAAFA